MRQVQGIEASQVQIQPFHPLPNADCDVAAVVYGPGDDPDTLLRRFAEGLQRHGADVVGILQRRRMRSAKSRLAPAFTLVGDGDGMPAGGRGARNPAEDCGLTLRSLAERLSQLMARRPDVVVLNRFGWLEANGSGLLGALGIAVEHDIPAVIAVPEPLFENWLSATDGLAVRLRCNLASLDHWYAVHGRGSAPSASRSTFCERWR
ncbi:MAG: hypothetical protein CMM50_00735 [Rhodospirillaceae bacterium]|nr:hypothetical protein [Rhodospirillaceae bacterium]